MTKQLHTVFDTDFDLSDINDCHELIDTLEEIGKIRTWQLYDLIATTEQEQVQGNADDYQQFLKDIAEQFGQVINVDRELCTDDAAAKTILSQYSRNIDHYFRTNGGQPFIIPVDATQFICDEIEQFTLEGFGTATEANHIPVQQVEVLQIEPHLVTRVLEPFEAPETGLKRIGSVDGFNVYVLTKNWTHEAMNKAFYDDGTPFYVEPCGSESELTEDILDAAKNLVHNFFRKLQ